MFNTSQEMDGSKARMVRSAEHRTHQTENQRTKRPDKEVRQSQSHIGNEAYPAARKVHTTLGKTYAYGGRQHPPAEKGLTEANTRQMDEEDSTSSSPVKRGLKFIYDNFMPSWSLFDNSPPSPSPSKWGPHGLRATPRATPRISADSEARKTRSQTACFDEDVVMDDDMTEEGCQRPSSPCPTSSPGSSSNYGTSCSTMGTSGASSSSSVVDDSFSRERVRTFVKSPKEFNSGKQRADGSAYSASFEDSSSPPRSVPRFGSRPGAAGSSFSNRDTRYVPPPSCSHRSTSEWVPRSHVNVPSGPTFVKPTKDSDGEKQRAESSNPSVNACPESKKYSPSTPQHVPRFGSRTSSYFAKVNNDTSNKGHSDTQERLKSDAKERVREWLEECERRKCERARRRKEEEMRAHEAEERARVRRQDEEEKRRREAEEYEERARQRRERADPNKSSNSGKAGSHARYEDTSGDMSQEDKFRIFEESMKDFRRSYERMKKELREIEELRRIENLKWEKADREAREERERQSRRKFESCEDTILRALNRIHKGRNFSSLDEYDEYRRRERIERAKKGAPYRPPNMFERTPSPIRLRYPKNHSPFSRKRTTSSAPSKPSPIDWYKTSKIPRLYFKWYESEWTTINSSNSSSTLNFSNVPWPLCAFPKSPEEVTPAGVNRFMQECHVKLEGGLGIRAAAKRELLNWHPDKFATRVIGRVTDDAEREVVSRAADVVQKTLTELMSAPEAGPS